MYYVVKMDNILVQIKIVKIKKKQKNLKNLNNNKTKMPSTQSD